jgi:hypothetical protein
MNDDHEEIRSLISSYAELIDERSGRDTLRSLWSGGVKTYQGGLPNTRHVITNVNVRLSPDRSSATSQSYVTVLQALPDLSLQAVAVSIHRDTFAKVDGAWRFTERRDRQARVGDLSRHVNGVAG